MCPCDTFGISDGKPRVGKFCHIERIVSIGEKGIHRSNGTEGIRQMRRKIRRKEQLPIPGTVHENDITAFQPVAPPFRKIGIMRAPETFSFKGKKRLRVQSLLRNAVTFIVADDKFPDTRHIPRRRGIISAPETMHVGVEFKNQRGPTMPLAR